MAETERERIARIVALAGLATTNGDGRWMPPNDKWNIEDWHRRVLECIPHDAERRCYETADAILALRGEEEDGARGSAARLASEGKPALDGWRPIAEAPRDGTLLLLAHVEGDLPVIGVNHGDGLFRRPEDDSEFYPQPTHWRPLPPPPAPDAVSELGSGNAAKPDAGGAP